MQQRKNTRRQAREWAVQMLFQSDLNPGEDVDKMIYGFWVQQLGCKQDENPLPLPAGEELPTPEFSAMVLRNVAPAKIREFAEVRVRGTLEHLDEIDQLIEEYSKNWPLYRIGALERSVLRLAVYELLYCKDVPPPVVMNEAIDIAKYFSNTGSGRFVNGILDQIRKGIES